MNCGLVAVSARKVSERTTAFGSRFQPHSAGPSSPRLAADATFAAARSTARGRLTMSFLTVVAGDTPQVTTCRLTHSCNNYRWDYTSEEFQHILKLGVWLRTQIERRTTFGRASAAAFLAYERTRQGRRVSANPSSTSPRKDRNG
jgi:hypothetical protein